MSVKGKCNHKNIKRYKTYVPGDFYAYTKVCSDCGAKSGGWTPEEAEKGKLRK